MLLESDGTVLVHDEPDNNTTGGTSAWYKLTPDSKGSYIDGTWSKIASMPAEYTPLYFASAILPDGRMIVEGGEYIGRKRGVDEPGRDLQPGDQHLGFRRTATGLDEHRGRRERGPGQRHLHAPAGRARTCLTNPEASVDDALLNAKTLKWRVIPATGQGGSQRRRRLDPGAERPAADGRSLGAGRRPSCSTRAPCPGRSRETRPRTATRSTRSRSSRSGRRPRCRAATRSWSGPARARKSRPRRAPRTRTRRPRCITTRPGPRARGPPGRRSRPSAAQEFDTTDGPGATLPDGNVLFDASACVYNTPTHFFVYNASSNTLTQIPDVPNAPNDTSYATRMLDLPNGQVLFNDGHQRCCRSTRPAGRRRRRGGLRSRP